MDVVLTFSPPPRFCDTFEFYVSPWVKEGTTREDDENTHICKISRGGVYVSSVIIPIVRSGGKNAREGDRARETFFLLFRRRVVGEKKRKGGSASIFSARQRDRASSSSPIGKEASAHSLSHAMDRDSCSYFCGGCERTAAEGRAMPME